MTDITINDIIPYTQAYASSPGQTVFSTTWTANAASDVLVFQTPSGSPPSDATQQLGPTAYTVQFIGGSQTVQITLAVGANLGDKITIIRNTPAAWLNLYSNTNFTPSMLNNDFGILTLVDQQAQLYNQVVAPRYNFSATILPIVDTILPVLGANQVWAKNSTNTAIIATDIGSGGGAPVDATYILESANATLTNSFVLTAGSGISFTTGGGLLTISSNGATVVAALNKIVTQVFTSNGTYTPTVGMKFCEVEIVGGGGAGGGVSGGTASQCAAAAGGSAGGYCQKLYTAANIGASAALVIGAAGAGAVAGPNAGGNGGDSTFTPSGTGVTLTAQGGQGGSGMAKSASAQIAAPGNAGFGINGDLNIEGGRGGQSATLAAGELCMTGAGGGSVFGQNTGGRFDGVAGDGNTGAQAIGYGSGSGGAYDLGSSDKASTPGTAGVCIVTEYCSV